MSLTLALIGGAVLFVGGGALIIKRQIEKEVSALKNWKPIEEEIVPVWKSIAYYRLELQSLQPPIVRYKDCVFLIQEFEKQRRVIIGSRDERASETPLFTLLYATADYNKHIRPWLENSFSTKELIAKVKGMRKNTGIFLILDS